MAWMGSYLGVLARVLEPHKDHAEARALITVTQQIRRGPSINSRSCFCNKIAIMSVQVTAGGWIPISSNESESPASASHRYWAGPVSFPVVLTARGVCLLHVAKLWGIALPGHWDVVSGLNPCGSEVIQSWNFPHMCLLSSLSSGEPQDRQQAWISVPCTAELDAAVTGLRNTASNLLLESSGTKPAAETSRHLGLQCVDIVQWPRALGAFRASNITSINIQNRAPETVPTMTGTRDRSELWLQTAFLCLF